MRFIQSLRGTASLAVLTALLTGAGAASAQTVGDDEVTSVEELVVTAQKREENLQNVPVVVTALSAQALQNAGVHDIKDMAILTPGLTVTSTSNESVTTARIRGIGTVGDNAGLESSVGVVIDGVYRPRNGVGFGDLGEMQRIEVLKGPQGTLFGKNTSAGVINILTKAPSFTFGAEGELTAGNYGAYGAAASITGPLSDKAAARLYVAKRVRDGFQDVRTGGGPRTEKQDQDQDVWTVRGQLLLQPSDKIEIRVIGDYSKREENCCVGSNILLGPTAPAVDLFAGGTGAGGTGIGIPADPFNRTVYANRGTEQEVEDRGVSIEASFDFDSLNATLTSVTALRDWSTVNGQDSDMTAADIAYRPADGSFGNEFTTFSQELRFAGSTDKLDWLVGGFFANEDLDSRQSLYYGSVYEPYFGNILLGNIQNFVRYATGLPISINTAGGSAFVSQMSGLPFGTNFVAGNGQKDSYAQNDKTYALFTNNTWHATEALDVTLGLRYTVDEKEVDSHYTNVGGGNACGASLTPARQAAILANLAGRGVPAGPDLNSNGIGDILENATRIAVGTLCLPWTNPLFNNRTTHQDRSDEEISGTIKAAYRWSPQVMTYASYARGFKAGGFNLDRSQSSTGTQAGGTGVLPVDDTSFPAETVDSYEIGAKTTWLNNSLLLNATLFYQKYEDFQLNTFLGTSFIVEAIPEVTSKGVDADVLWFTPVHGLTLQGGLTYAKTEYGNFKAGDLTAPARYPYLALLSGATASFAPEWSLTGSITYDREIGHNLRFLANLSGKWTSEYNTGSDLLPAKQQDSFGLLNGRLGIGSADKRWTFEIWGQNLTDEEYVQVAFNAFLQGNAIPPWVPNYIPSQDTQTYNAFLGQPRTYGATLRFRY
jgi:iron complex outermembrane receptor protein